LTPCASEVYKIRNKKRNKNVKKKKTKQAKEKKKKMKESTDIEPFHHSPLKEK
jgi:hypothetical protein